MSIEGVDNILVVVGNWCLEEEAEVAQDGAKRLIVNFDARKQFTQDKHIVHKGNSKEGILTHIVRADGVGSTEENLGRVLIKSSLAVSNERVILDNNFVINFITNVAGALF